MGIVTKQTLTQAGRKTIRVAVSEWDGEIILRALSAAQQIAHVAYNQALGDELGGLARSSAWLLTAAWIDEDGKQVLPLGEIDLLLETQTADLLVDLGLKIAELSGSKPNANASAEKNSGSSQS